MTTKHVEVDDANINLPSTSTAEPPPDNEEIDKKKVKIFLRLSQQVRKSKPISFATITPQELERRLQKTDSGRYFTQLYVTLVASLGSLIFGLNVGWNNPAYGKDFVGNNTTVIETTSHTIGIMLLGCIAGIPPCSYGVSYWGPKHAMLYHLPFYFLVMLFARTRRMRNLLTTSTYFLCGFVGIIVKLSGESLLMDAVHPFNFPHMIVLCRSSTYIGMLLSYAVGDKLWVEVLFLVLSAINFAMLFVVPESPVFLFKYNRPKAERALLWFRGRQSTHTSLRLLQRDQDTARVDSQSRKSMLRRKVVLKAFSIVLVLSFFQVFSGYYVLLFYHFVYWDAFHVNTKHRLALGTCVCLSSALCTLANYRLTQGARAPLITSVVLVSICLTLQTFHIYLYFEMRLEIVREQTWLAPTLCYLYVIFYDAGLNCYAEILLFNYVPFQVLSKLRTFLLMFVWFQRCVLVAFFLPTIAKTSFLTVHIVFTVISYFGILFCCCCIVEIKDRTLTQIQTDMGGNPVGSTSAYRNRSWHTPTHSNVSFLQSI